MSPTKQQITEVHRKLTDALRAAETHTDPELSDEGLKRRREAMAEEARKRYEPTINEYRRDVGLAQSNDGRSFDKVRSRVDWGKPGAAAQAQAKWESIRTRLDAGVSPFDVIADADSSQIAAMREYFPAWAEAQAPRTANPGRDYERPSLAGFERALDERDAEVGGAGSRYAYSQHRQSEALAAWAGPTFEQIDKIVSGQQGGMSPMQSAVAAALAEQAEAAPAREAAEGEAGE